jgi:hypothetical protein
MSLCINNDLIWVSIPKCASTSTEHAFYNSGLDITHIYFENKKVIDKHIHFQIDYLYNKFGVKETVCIKRDYFERWLSALVFLWEYLESKNITPIVPWEEIDNNTIYEIFNKDYIDRMHNSNPDDIVDLDRHFLKDKEQKDIVYFGLHLIFCSQMYWVNNKKCTYEFDITEIDKFEKFISDRYSIDFKIPSLNKTIKNPNKIVPDEKLKKWVFDNFEKRFISRNSLI